MTKPQFSCSQRARSSSSRSPAAALAQAAVGIEQRQPRRAFEVQQGAALDSALDEEIELAQRVARDVALEIVLGPEHILPAGLALAASAGIDDRRFRNLLSLAGL